MAAQNKVAWLDKAGVSLRVGDAEMPQPGAGEIVIRNHAIAINPIDAAQAGKGVFVKAFPRAIGQDVAGEVVAVGAEVTKFRVGDRALGHGWNLLTGQPAEGAFALYTRLKAQNSAKVPATVSFAQAAVFPLGIDTAAAGLYQASPFLGLPLPTTTTKPASTGKAVVVYGGSSSVGLTATQLAAASGVRVISLASPHNHALCRSAGASETFDYRDADLVDRVVKAVGDDTFAGLYNAIGDDNSTQLGFKLLEALGGGNVVSTKALPENLPAGVQGKQVFGLGDFTFPLWDDFVGQALELGYLKCLPEPQVVGTGLESLQKGLDLMAAGVSGKKLVVEL